MEHLCTSLPGIQRIHGVFTDDRQLLVFFGGEGQYVVAVLQKDDAFGGDLTGEGVLFVPVVGLLLRNGTGGEGKHTLYGGIDLLHGHVPVFQTCLQLLQDEPVNGHLQVKACGYGFCNIVDGAPVGDNHALVAPFFFEDLGEELFMLGAPHGVHLVIGAHDARGVALFHGDLKGTEIDLPHGAFIHVGAGVYTVFFLVVHGIVLETGGNAIVLRAVDVACYHLSSQNGIFGDVFKVSAAEHIPLDIHPGA